jgi:glutamate-ammonia-ligase adenylyltransferase
MRLRPAGADGPIAVSLPAFTAYFSGEAETWELMALTRARVVWASDVGFGQRVAREVESVLRRPRPAPALARAAAEMRATLEREKPATGPWSLKQAPGGLVDIEFAAQLLQLAHAVHGGPLRVGTDGALQTLGADGRVAPKLARELGVSWRLQSRLAQLMAAALEPGTELAGEPSQFLRKLARAGQARSFPALEAKLARTQARTRAAWLSVVRATESAGRDVQRHKGPTVRTEDFHVQNDASRSRGGSDAGRGRFGPGDA